MQTEKTIVIVGAVVILCFLGFMFLLVLFYSNKKKILIEKTIMEKSFANELLHTRLEIQEETFRSISQEIHDNIGQSLTLVKLNLAMTKPDNSEQVSEMLQESARMLTVTIQDLRNLSHSLNPDFLASMGLAAAIEQLLQQLEKTGRYHTFLSTEGCPEENNVQKDLVVLRVVQELLNNIIKHAQATKINITMNYLGTKLVLKVTDNGIGFNIETIESKTGKKGIGLLNMHNRMKMINGSITFQTAPMHGTTSTIQVEF